jgi:hypothetical protein
MLGVKVILVMVMNQKLQELNTYNQTPATGYLLTYLQMRTQLCFTLQLEFMRFNLKVDQHQVEQLLRLLVQAL